EGPVVGAAQAGHDRDRPAVEDPGDQPDTDRAEHQYRHAKRFHGRPLLNASRRAWSIMAAGTGAHPIAAPVSSSERAQSLRASSPSLACRFRGASRRSRWKYAPLTARGSPREARWTSGSAPRSGEAKRSRARPVPIRRPVRVLSRATSVATAPGWKAVAVMPVPAARRASSRVNRTVASLEAA